VPSGLLYEKSVFKKDASVDFMITFRLYLTHFAILLFINMILIYRTAGFSTRIPFASGRNAVALIHRLSFGKDITFSTSSEDVKSKMQYLLSFDGGSRGNPGVAGAGAVICERKGKDSNTGGIHRKRKNISPATLFDEGSNEEWKEIWHGYVHLGSTVTNNVAEYQGLIFGLKAASCLRLPWLIVAGDSELVIKQMKGTICSSSSLCFRFFVFY
jgi:ribonuclease HI